MSKNSNLMFLDIRYEVCFKTNKSRMEQFRVLMPLLLLLTLLQKWKQFMVTRSLALCSVVVGLCANISGGAAFAEDISGAKKTTRSSPVKFTLSLGTGFGQYQDVQVPENLFSGTRGDGTTISRENDTHYGFPVEVAADLAYDFGPVTLGVRGGGTHIAAFTAPWETSMARYRRYEGATRLRADWKMDKMWTLLAATEVGYRRSAFLNSSTGHYIDGVMPGLTGGLAYGPNVRADTTYRFGAYSRLGFQAEDDRQSGLFRRASATMSEVEARLSYRLVRGSWIVAKFQQESVGATINNVDEYQDFGLSVDSATIPKPSRSYQLTTRIFGLGFEKLF